MSNWKDDFLEFSKRLVQFREAKNLSIIELATALDIPVTTYREWENGRAIRGLPYLRIAEILEISLTELMTGHKPDKTLIFSNLDQIEELLREQRRLLNSFI